MKTPFIVLFSALVLLGINSFGQVPTVITKAISHLTASAASSGGNVTNPGGSPVTVEGIVYGTTADPTTDDNVVTFARTPVTYTSTTNRLTANTTYHVRAYATNSIGTGYGADISFTTPSIILITAATNPSVCGPYGSIQLTGLDINTLYDLTYTKDTTVTHVGKIYSDNIGAYTIQGLDDATYSNITVTDPTGHISLAARPQYIQDNCVAKQSVKFMSALYTQFPGITDDDPKGFTQSFIRVSFPLSRIYGIKPQKNILKRFISLRNFVLQLDYGSYPEQHTFDTLKSRYANRLDLFTKANFRATSYVNLFTYVFPISMDKNAPNEGELAHLYVDFFSALSQANVTDYTIATDSFSKKIYTWAYGLNIKINYYSLFHSRFSAELSGKWFHLYSATNSLNTNLSPQLENVKDIYLPENTTKPFISDFQHISKFYNIDALVFYNTSSDVNNASNAFIHYSYTSNFPSIGSTRYNNHYFQFQLGYNLDLTKLLSKP